MTIEVLNDIAKALERQNLLSLGAVIPDLTEDKLYFRQWLAEERHGTMKYLEQHDGARSRLDEIMPGACSVIVFALNYDVGDRLQFEKNASSPRVAQYARIRDYHKLMRRLAEAALKTLTKPESFIYRVCIDTAPLFERAIAAQTGSGFIGKNTCFIHQEHGSLMLLGEILTNVSGGLPTKSTHLPGERTKVGGCGSCRRCQVHCPTGALDKDYTIDARRCLSYLTIEHRGTIPKVYWPALKQYWFGCDICQLVCPYNRGTNTIHVKPEWQTDVANLDLALVAMMNEVDYQSWFGGTPMTRAKRQGLRRNALIALTMTDVERALPIVKQCLKDEDLVVRNTAQELLDWSLGRDDLA